ncbi:MAG: PTS transporter subunit EIIB [Lacrimispora sp.]
MAINVKELSDSIMKLIGEKENVHSVTHCVTRLRFILKDANKANTEEIKKLDGVLGVVLGSGQYQIVLGPNLFPVFEYITKEYGLETEKEVDEYHAEDTSSEKSSGVGYYLGKVVQFLSASLTPFITVLYGPVC